MCAHCTRNCHAYISHTEQRNKKKTMMMMIVLFVAVVVFVTQAHYSLAHITQITNAMNNMAWHKNSICEHIRQFQWIVELAINSWTKRKIRSSVVDTGKLWFCVKYEKCACDNSKKDRSTKKINFNIIISENHNKWTKSLYNAFVYWFSLCIQIWHALHACCTV